MPARINLAERPSRIIDVAGWLTLFRVITEAAAKSQDKVEGRRLGYEAAQCLDEALRFYVEDNDLPPEGAFFSKSTQLRRQENPELFARSRLINMRARLPSIDAMERRLAGGTATKKKWWKPWA